jgi:formylglycine-generating enzyme required for sulfatase activity
VAGSLLTRAAAVLCLVAIGCALPDDFTKVDTGAGGSGGTPIPTAPEGRSCDGNDPTLDACGPEENESCCAVRCLPGGEFLRDNNATYPAKLSPYCLDKYEVSIARFRAFLAAGGPAPADGAGKHPYDPDPTGWRQEWNNNLPMDWNGELANCAPYGTWTNAPGSTADETRAINCNSWYHAFAFCVWDGGRLPSEAEWNFAATGGAEQRIYPWSSPPSSDVITHDRAVYGCQTDPPPCPAQFLVAPVGSKPLGNARWGHADLAGNVWEWTLDWKWWDESGMPVTSTTYDLPCSDCVGFDTDTTKNPNSHHPIRGGGFFTLESEAEYLRATAHGSFEPYTESFAAGFRCARDP